MKQCKLCGMPFRNDANSIELKDHWKKHHSWHWEKNNEQSPEDAILKKR